MVAKWPRVCCPDRTVIQGCHRLGRHGDGSSETGECSGVTGRYMVEE